MITIIQTLIKSFWKILMNLKNEYPIIICMSSLQSYVRKLTQKKSQNVTDAMNEIKECKISKDT